MNVLFGSVYSLVFLICSSHYTSKTVPSEISMSGDYLRLATLPRPQGFDQPNLPRSKDFDHFLKNCPEVAHGGGGGGMVMLGIDWDIIASFWDICHYTLPACCYATIAI